jgi:putative phosphoribosyl transferase
MLRCRYQFNFRVVMPPAKLFVKLTGRNMKSHERFPNLRSAGRELALKLEAYGQRHDVVVLALLLGGSLVAHEVAKILDAPLDVVIIRRLFTGGGPGSQVCAVNVCGSLVFNEELVPYTDTPSTPVEYFTADAIAGLERRALTCRGERPPTNLAGKIVVLVDCGIRTGSTMQAAIEALKTKEPAQIVAAVPVASLEGHASVLTIADEVVCLAHPEPFGHVGLWYTDFSRPGEELIGELLQASF